MTLPLYTTDSPKFFGGSVFVKNEKPLQRPIS